MFFIIQFFFLKEKVTSGQFFPPVSRVSYCASSIVNEEDIRACELVSMVKTVKEFNEDSCFDLDVLAHRLREQFELPDQNAMQVLFQALCKIAERVSAPGSVPVITVAGSLDDEGKVKEEYIGVFNRLSPLLTSTSVRPDFWLKTDLAGIQNIPVLLFEIVSRPDESFEDIQSMHQTLLKAVCNTINLMRLYMNILKSDVAFIEMSTIVIPKWGAVKFRSAVCVSVRWGDEAGNWQFQVSFKPIPIEDFVEECKHILSKQFKFITEQPLDPSLCSEYLVRLYNLPPTMTQIKSKHSIVILDATTPGKKRILKFTPRMTERRWLSDLVMQGKPSAAAAKPEKPVRLNQLLFFTYPVLLPPLPNTLLLKCFRGFVLETAKALHELHKEEIAHLDVRPFNVCFRLVVNQGVRAARAVLIDLDRGTWTSNREMNLCADCAQYTPPRGWPKDVAFTAARCDWRQWALMLWSLLVPTVEHAIYSEEKDQLGSCPLAFLDAIICKHEVGMDEDLLLNEITSWVDSSEMEQAKLLQVELNTSDLATEVRLEL